MNKTLKICLPPAAWGGESEGTSQVLCTSLREGLFPQALAGISWETAISRDVVTDHRSSSS